MGRQHTDADRIRAHRQGQQNIRRRCTCGRTITGNAAWWSHLNAKAAATLGCAYDGRA